MLALTHVPGHRFKASPRHASPQWVSSRASQATKARSAVIHRTWLWGAEAMSQWIHMETLTSPTVSLYQAPRNWETPHRCTFSFISLYPKAYSSIPIWPAWVSTAVPIWHPRYNWFLGNINSSCYHRTCDAPQYKTKWNPDPQPGSPPGLDLGPPASPHFLTSSALIAQAIPCANEYIWSSQIYPFFAWMKLRCFLLTF